MQLDSSPAPRPSDAEIIAASLKQSELFATIFDRHYVAIYRYLVRRGGRQTGEDLASQTFTIAFERRAGFDPRAGSARPWLYGVATNLLRNDLRARRRARAVLELAGRVGNPGVSTTDVQHESVFPHDRLGEALAQLDSDQRDTLLLLAWGELSYPEIATALAVPLGTVRSRIARARERLRAQLQASASQPMSTRRKQPRCPTS